MRLNFAIFCLIILSCSNQKSAHKIIDSTTKHYFPTGLANKKISFDFRDKSYSVTRFQNQFIYTRSFLDSVGHIEDILVNSSHFARLINNDTVNLKTEWREKYTASVNSVLYFFQIPLVLNDPAAITELQGTTEIKGKTYWSISVTFDKNQGGEDYNDKFCYWIDQTNNSIDYFAYSYEVDGGGVRFREAFNQRRIEGLLFQDYINYEVKIGTDLNEIPLLFTSGKLIELSRVINENISITDL